MAARQEILLIEIRENGARVVRRSINDIGGAATEAESAVSQLGRLLGGVVSTKLLKKNIMLADTYANLMNRIRVVTNSNFELQKAMEGVYDMTIDTRTSLEANVDLFARVKLNTDRMGLSMKQVLEFATSLNHAVILSGVTAREAQWGMVQFSQALAAGALRGDELRAVMEQLPVVTKVIAKHMGVTRGELRLLAFQGRVTSQVMIDAFSKTKGAADELAELFAKRIPTIDQGLTALRSSWIRFIGVQDEAFKGTATMAEGLMFVSKNIDILGRFAEIAAIIIGGVLIANVLRLDMVMQVFNFTLLRTHWLMGTFAIAAVGLVVFSDKIKLNNVGMATLSDTVAAFIPEIKNAAQGVGEFVAEAVKATNIGFDMDTTFEDLVMNAARFSDDFVGIFTSIYAVMKNSFDNQINFVIRAVLRTGAFFKALGVAAKKTFTLIKVMATSAAEAIKATLAGKNDLAGSFVDQAKKAASAIKKINVSDFFEEPDLSKFQDSGREAGEVWWESFEGRGTQSADMIARVLKRAQDVAKSRTEGTVAEPGDEMSLTPVESKLFKRLTGDIEGLMAKAATLKDLFFKDVYGSILQVGIALKKGSISAAEHAEQLSILGTKALKFADSQAELQILLEKGAISEFQYSIALYESNRALEERAEILQNLSPTQEQYNRETVQGQINQLKANTDMASGFKRGFLELGLEIQDFAALAEKTVTNAFSSMEDAMVSFVTTGKMDFKGMVDSVLADLTRLIIRLMLVKALQSSGMGGMFGIAASTATTASASSGKAAGGNLSPGGTFRVGEDGPEMLTMGNRGGHITNARDTAKMDGTSAAAQEITIINLWAEDDIGAYLNDDNKGGRIIVNKSPGQGKNQVR